MNNNMLWGSWDRGYVYLIHLERQLNRGSERDRRSAQHYMGWTSNLAGRVQLHEQGLGSRFLACAVRLKIPFSVVRVWRGGRSLEKRLKGRKKHAVFCPVCNPDSYDSVFPAVKYPALTVEEIEDQLVGF